MNNIFSNYPGGNDVASWISSFGPALIVLIIWSLFWKGLGLWHSGRRGEPWWFVIMLVVNTIGILEIIYLFLVLRLRLSELFSKSN